MRRIDRFLKLAVSWAAFLLLAAFCALGSLAWGLAVLPALAVMTYIDHWKSR